jgi:hypothetical protein
MTKLVLGGEVTFVPSAEPFVESLAEAPAIAEPREIFSTANFFIDYIERFPGAAIPAKSEYLRLFADRPYFDKDLSVQFRKTSLQEMLQRLCLEDALYVVKSSDILNNKDVSFVPHNPYTINVGDFTTDDLLCARNYYGLFGLDEIQTYLSGIHTASKELFYINSVDQLSLFLKHGKLLREYAAGLSLTADVQIKRNLLTCVSCNIPWSTTIFSIDKLRKFIERTGTTTIRPFIVEYGEFERFLSTNIAQVHDIIPQFHSCLKLNSPELVRKEEAYV